MKFELVGAIANVEVIAGGPSVRVRFYLVRLTVKLDGER
jgi:hypothetical protein